MAVLNEKAELEKVVNDRSRKIKIRGKQAIVPLKFDKDGEPATQDRLIFKRLSLNDLRFLSVWRSNAWDIEKSRIECGLDEKRIAVLVRKLACFREEDAKVKALCEIPTSDWIASKHVENVYNGGTVGDSEHKSLQELAKIEGAYKNNVNLNVTQNVFNLPKYDPATEAKLKEIAEKEAMIIQDAQVVHG